MCLYPTWTTLTQQQNQLSLPHRKIRNNKNVPKTDQTKKPILDYLNKWNTKRYNFW